MMRDMHLLYTCAQTYELFSSRGCRPLDNGSEALYCGLIPLDPDLPQRTTIMTKTLHTVERATDALETTRRGYRAITKTQQISSLKTLDEDTAEIFRNYLPSGFTSGGASANGTR